MTAAPDETVAAWAKALSDPMRVRVVARLADGDGSPTELAAHFGIVLPLMSYHLGHLSRGGLVTVRRHGRHRVYTLFPRFAAVIRSLVRMASPETAA